MVTSDKVNLYICLKTVDVNYSLCYSSEYMCENTEDMHILKLVSATNESCLKVDYLIQWYYYY